MKQYTQDDFKLKFIKEVAGRKRKNGDQVDRCGEFRCIKCGNIKTLVLATATRNLSGLCVKCSTKIGRNEIKCITQEQLKERLLYDKLTGVFTYVNNPKKEAGSVTHGYRIISIGYKKYFAHRLAWLYEYGTFPDRYLDHINHNKLDNSIANLREVTPLENTQSALLYKNNKSGYHGVIWNKDAGNWRARIGVEGKTLNLGSFANKEDAIAARKAAEVKYGFHSNHGIINP